METSIKYQLIVPEQFDEAIKLFNDQFLSNAPMSKAIQAPKHNQAADQAIHHFLEQGLSWCVVDKKSGEMVGMSMNCFKSQADLPDVSPTFEEYVGHGLSRETSSVAVMLDSAFEIKSILIANQESKMFEVFALSVNSGYKHKGIASELVKRSLEHAVTLGYKLAGAICTSFYTQRLFEKHGFERVKEVCYATYVDTRTNSCLFKNVEEPHKAAISYVKKLC